MNQQEKFLLGLRALLDTFDARLFCPAANDIDDICVIGPDWTVSLYDEVHAPEHSNDSTPSDSNSERGLDDDD